jgi:starch synthase
MQKLRILFITSEIEPFLKITSAADVIRMLPQGLQELGHEIRILMPKFGIINERRNRLHEVVRLSGINIRVGNEEKPLTIKVASIPNAKLQVYFLDNLDYFNRKSALINPENNEFYADNDERLIFFCKGAIETVKKLGWPPDIIHCHDWMTSLVPLYMKTYYKDDPMFKNTKVVYSVYDNDITTPLSDNFVEKASLDMGSSDLLKGFAKMNYPGISMGGVSFADAIVRAGVDFGDTVEKELAIGNKPVLAAVSAEDKKEYIGQFHRLYCDILN